MFTVETNLFSRFDLTVDVLEHQWQTFSVHEIKVFNGDLTLLRPFVWRTIIWVDPCSLEKVTSYYQLGDQCINVRWNN